MAAALLLCLLALPAMAQRATPVADADNLIRLLREAKPGAILQLAPGDYGPLILQGVQGAPDGWITLRADPGTVHFSRLDLRDSAYVSLEGMVFDYDFVPGDPPNLRPFEITGSRHIHITGSLFDGDVARGVSPVSDGFPTAYGLSVRGSAETLVAGNEIRNFYRGFLAARSGGIFVRDNDLHGLRMDGMNFAQVQNVRIEGNRIRDFKRSIRSEDHADMIQFWTNRTDTPSTDIVIRDNVLNSGTGFFTQSIFMRNDLVDRGLAGDEMFYRDIVIENNVVINAHLNGIVVGETDGLVIRNNTVLHNAASEGTRDDPGLWIPQIRISPAARDVTVTGNVAARIAGHENQRDWTLADNLLVQDSDPALPDYYDDHFRAARTGDPRDLVSFAYLPGSVIDGHRIGASHLVQPASEAALTPAVDVARDAGFVNRFVLDAAPTTGPANQINDATRYEWRLPDGAVRTGQRIVQTFERPGSYSVTLRVLPPEGDAAETAVTLDVPNRDVVTYDSADGVFRAWDGPNSARAIGTPNEVGPAPLNNGRARITIEREDMLPFFSATDFELGMRLRAADTYRSAGELLRIHKTLILDITGRGALTMDLMTARADRLRLRTPAVGLTDGDWHDIRIVYSSARARAEIFVDGQLVASGQTTGPIRPVEHWGLELGNPFNNRKSFDGALERFYLRANVEGFAPG